jgi:NAD(P)H-dependent FMN reductase
MNSLSTLIIPGSLRTGSLSHKLAVFAAHRARVANHVVTEMDLRELALPIYDGDIEALEGVPEGTHQLLQAIVRSDAILVVTPEYNGFPTPLVINAFDWLSRIMASPGQVAGLAATANKPVALLSASPGPAGALRSMNYLRQYLQMAFGMIVVPQQFALGKAHEAFDETGGLKDLKAGQSVDAVLSALTRLALALKISQTA